MLLKLLKRKQDAKQYKTQLKMCESAKPVTLMSARLQHRDDLYPLDRYLSDQVDELTLAKLKMTLSLETERGKHATILVDSNL